MEEIQAMRFELRAAFGAVIFYPCNDAARAAVPGGRKTLSAQEFDALVDTGAAIQVAFRSYRPRAWMTIARAAA